MDTQLGGRQKLTGKQLEELFHSVVPREAISGILERIQIVNFNALDHKGDVIRPSVAVKVCKDDHSVRRGVKQSI